MLHLEGFYQLSGGTSRYHLMRQTLGMYRRATFSLQPPGDDPARKGIIDSLTCGCIPVLFHPAQRRLWPYHWGAWANASSVLIHTAAGGETEAGSTPHARPHARSYDPRQPRHTDVLAALAAIPQEEVRRMQAAIAANAHRLVYGFGDEFERMGKEDAMGVLLRLLGPRVRRGELAPVPAESAGRASP